jgi:hypothetical protein
LLYKGQGVVIDAKMDFKPMPPRIINSMYLPPQGKILHIANDYGQLDVLFSVSKTLAKPLLDSADEEKRSAAKPIIISKAEYCMQMI